MNKLTKQQHELFSMLMNMSNTIFKNTINFPLLINPVKKIPEY